MAGIGAADEAAGRLRRLAQRAWQAGGRLGATTRLLACWSVLAGSGLLAPHIGAERALLIGLAAAAALAAWGADPAPDERRPVPLALLLGLVAGLCTMPVWAGAAAALGLALGLAPGAGAAGGEPGAAALLAMIVVGPLFEERLYRGVLLDAVRRRVRRALPAGLRSDALAGGLAVLAGAALFAISHLEPWSVLGTFLVGVALGSTRLAGGSVALCVALHAGLNLALQAGATPDPDVVIVGGGVWIAAAALARRGPSCAGGTHARPR